MLPHLADKDEPDLRTMREVVKMTSSIHPMIQLTGDCPSLNNDKRMPLLNTKIQKLGWRRECKIFINLHPLQQTSSPAKVTSVKGTVHQMYECVSDILLHLDRMLGVVIIDPAAHLKGQVAHLKGQAALLKGTGGTSQRNPVHFVRTHFCVFWPNLTSLNHENDTQHPIYVGVTRYLKHIHTFDGRSL